MTAHTQLLFTRNYCLQSTFVNTQVLCRLNTSTHSTIAHDQLLLAHNFQLHATITTHTKILLKLNYYSRSTIINELFVFTLLLYSDARARACPCLRRFVPCMCVRSLAPRMRLLQCSKIIFFIIEFNNLDNN